MSVRHVPDAYKHKTKQHKISCPPKVLSLRSVVYRFHFGVGQLSLPGHRPGRILLDGSHFFAPHRHAREVDLAHLSVALGTHFVDAVLPRRFDHRRRRRRATAAVRFLCGQTQNRPDE